MYRFPYRRLPITSIGHHLETFSEAYAGFVRPFRREGLIHAVKFAKWSVDGFEWKVELIRSKAVTRGTSWISPTLAVIIE